MPIQHTHPFLLTHRTHVMPVILAIPMVLVRLEISALQKFHGQSGLATFRLIDEPLMLVRGTLLALQRGIGQPAVNCHLDGMSTVRPLTETPVVLVTGRHMLPVDMIKEDLENHQWDNLLRPVRHRMRPKIRLLIQIVLVLLRMPIGPTSSTQLEPRLSTTAEMRLLVRVIEISSAIGLVGLNRRDEQITPRRMQHSRTTRGMNDMGVTVTRIIIIRAGKVVQTAYHRIPVRIALKIMAPHTLVRIATQITLSLMDARIATLKMPRPSLARIGISTMRHHSPARTAMLSAMTERRGLGMLHLVARRARIRTMVD